MIKADLIIFNSSELATPLGYEAVTGPAMDKIEIIKQGAVASLAGKIVFVGPPEELDAKVELLTGGQRIDANGGTLLPGFVDSHTHTVHAGSRAEEFNMRLKGATYADIAKAGGGILSTVRATRAASEDELVIGATRRLDRMMALGTTTVEIKSGYGLETKTELKMLRAINRLAESHPLKIAATFLGAHEVPPEYREMENGRKKYADLVINEMIPQVAKENLAEYCDIFTETGVYDIETSKRILNAAKDHGLKLRVHVDQLTPLGGTEMAAELGAVSADHLEFISERGIEMLAETGTFAGLLPGCVFFLMMDEYPPARKLIDAGASVLLATDFNPGSSHSESMPMTIVLASLYMKMTVAECITAATLNPAASLDMADSIGTIEVGKQADIVILDEPNHYHLVYHWGVNPVSKVVKDGKLVVG